MTAINSALHRLVRAIDTNPLNNKIDWFSNIHAHMLKLFFGSDVQDAASAPADTTKLWYEPHASNGGNGAFKVYDSGAWQAVTAGLFFKWLYARSGLSLGGSAGVTSVSVTAPITNAGTATAPTLGISAATAGAAGSMSAAHFTKLNGLPTITSIGSGLDLTSGVLTATGSIPALNAVGSHITATTTAVSAGTTTTAMKYGDHNSDGNNFYAVGVGSGVLVPGTWRQQGGPGVQTQFVRIA